MIAVKNRRQTYGIANIAKIANIANIEESEPSSRVLLVSKDCISKCWQCWQCHRFVVDSSRGSAINSREPLVQLIRCALLLRALIGRRLPASLIEFEAS